MDLSKRLWSAAKDVREGRTIAVPTHLRDAHYRGASQIGHGENYVYPHDAADGYVLQEYLGIDQVYYEPTESGAEAEIRRRLAELKTGRTDQSDG